MRLDSWREAGGGPVDRVGGAAGRGRRDGWRYFGWDLDEALPQEHRDAVARVARHREILGAVTVEVRDSDGHRSRGHRGRTHGPQVSAVPDAAGSLADHDLHRVPA